MLRDPEDFASLRKSIYDGAKDEFAKSFPQSKGGVRMEVHDLDYEDPDTYDFATQKEHLLQGKNLSRRLRGTVRLFSDTDNQMLDERRMTLMRVPHLTDRGTYINSGSEYTSLTQARLTPGPYTRIKANGEAECHLNIQRGTGSGFRIRFEPKSTLYKLDIGQSQLRLYSLLHDMGVKDDVLEKAWGPEILDANRKAYDSRVFDKAYARLVKKPDPLATREQKAAALHQAFDAMQVNKRITQKTLPNYFDREKAAAWKEEGEKRAAENAMVTFPPASPPPPAPIEHHSSPIAGETPSVSFNPVVRPTMVKVPSAYPAPSDIAWAKQFERTRSHVYRDSNKIPTIGVGYNLRNPDAARRLRVLGVDPKRVMAGSQGLSQAQIDQLLREDLIRARQGAGRVVPNFDRLPEPAQHVATDMAFNMGVTGLHGFSDFTGAMGRQDWPAAVRAMEQSKWFKTTGGRPYALRQMLMTLMNQKKSSVSAPWMTHVFTKLARAGAVVMLPTEDGKYLMERNADDDESHPGKLRPPGGGAEEEDDNLLDTIVREMHEEFGLAPEEIRKHIKFLGTEQREEFKGSGVFELSDHGLEAGRYQATNDPEEVINLEEVTLDDPDYCGPVIANLAHPANVP